MTDDEYRGELMESLQTTARTWSLMLCGVTIVEAAMATEARR